MNYLKIHTESKRELVQFETNSISFRANTMSSSIIVLGIISGLIMLAYHFMSHGEIGLVGVYIDISFILYSIYYKLFQKKKNNYLGASLCIIIGCLYLIFIFFISDILILNAALYGNNLSEIRVFPAIWPLLGSIIISMISSPVYISNLIKKKLYKINSKTNYGIIIAACGLGTAIARSFVSKTSFLIGGVFICLLISFLTMILLYQVYLFGLLIKKETVL